jgi:hypothetical protein
VARSCFGFIKLSLALVLLWGSYGFCTPLRAQEDLSTPCHRMNTIWEDALGNQGIGWGYRTSRLWYSGEEIWFSLDEPSTDQPQRIALLIQEFVDSPEEVVAEAEFPGTVSYTFDSHRFIYQIFVMVDWPHIGPKATLSDVGCDSTGEQQPFPINLGINDTWFVPNLDGHGVLLTVYPSIKKIFLALFTFDTQDRSDLTNAILGDAGQRWLTALGPYDGSTAHLDIDLTVGGIFLEAEPMPEWLPGGKIELKLDHCNSVTLDYDIPPIDRRGTLQLQRVAHDRIELCELLSVSENE